MKEPVEAQLPGGNSFLVILRMDKPGEWVPSTLLGDVSPNLCYGPVIEWGK